ncbi:hypothetical protein ACWGNN_44865 [Streptomyces sp. NPDC055817]
MEAPNSLDRHRHSAHFIGGVGGLVFTGIATYYGALVSADQLEQSREDSAKESRAQAVTFSDWDEGRKADWTVHVQNRSPDPVPWAQVTIYVAVEVQPSSPDRKAVVQLVQYGLETTRLAPCTTLVYSPKQLGRVISKKEDLDEGGAVVRKVVLVAGVQYAVFADRDGKIWKRTDQTLKPLKGDPEKAGPALRWVGQVNDEPKVQQAAACGGKG